MVSKAVLRMDSGETSYRAAQWRLFCFNADQFELDFQRKAVTDPSFATVSILSGEAKPQVFIAGRSRLPEYEIWGLRLNRAAVQSLAGRPQFDFTETSQTADGHPLVHAVKLSSDGLTGALESLLATCPPAKPAVTPVASRDGGAN